MAIKKKKTPAKAAKKKTATKSKAKPAVKAKKSKPAKAAKTASARTATASKKAVTKKPVKKAVVNQKKSVKVVKKKSVEAPKATEAPVSKPKVKPQVKIEPKNAQPEKVRVETTPKEQPVVKPAAESRTLPPVAQMNMFQIPNQRPIAHKPARTTTDETRTRYSEEELREFEKLIMEKLEKAREEYKILKDTLNRTNDEGTDATSGGNTKVLEDGAETAEKENLSQLAARQQKYITNLENALIRIKNGTYGICSVTGKLISKERLIAVPHTTQSIEAKMMKQD